jgi:hypothetical protein
MQQRSIPSPDPGADDATVERDILTLLAGARLWSVDELQRELANALAVTDALTRLHRAGLIHRLGEFVFITRAAQRSLQLTGI